MWTLVLIILFTSDGYKERSAAAATDHIEGFTSEKQCVEASRKIARERKDNDLKMYCVPQYSVSP